MQTEETTKQHAPPQLCLLGVICDRDVANRVTSLYEGHNIYFNLVALGWGTAQSSVLNSWGLDESEKACFFSILPADTGKVILKKLDAEMDFCTPGHGVAYTAPMHQVCYNKVVQLQNEDGGDTVNYDYQMIMAVVNRGYTEELMEVARAAGATGGTVLHARGTGMTGAEKFFGVTIQPDKELVIVLAATEDSCNIMQNIADKVGKNTDVNAVSFSFPVSNVKGIDCTIPAP